MYIEKKIEDIKTHFQNLRERSNFSNLKTSTQISVKFTLFTMLQVLLFSLLANGIFFQNRYKKQEALIPPRLNPVMQQKMVLGKNRMPEAEIFAINSPEWQTLLQLHRWKNIAKVDDMYFIYKEINNQLIVNNVTQHIIVQKNLIRISLYLMLLFWAIAYILSLFFVKSSLKKLNELLWFLDNLHIDNLHEKIGITGHPDDEINKVSEKFNEAFEKIHKQTLSLKDFVSNASHELKTPLMSMSTEIDYAMKTKWYEQGLSNIKQQIKWMNTLLETLVTISKLESLRNLPTELIDLSLYTKTTIDDVQKIYAKKNITIKKHMSNDVVVQAHKDSWNIIVKNILDNAFKFTPDEWSIEVTLDKKKLTIKDSGKWISASNLDHIRERFWQADRSKTDTKSFGLWLYLVKLLVEKHGWKIAMSSKVGKWTVCTISF